MQTIGYILLKVLIVLFFEADIIAAQDAEISFQSSSNFKAMEGFSFDMTCQVNESHHSVESHSIELFLPDGKRADNNDYATVGPPYWNRNAVELKIMKAVKSRDEGLYKCIVNGLRIIENHVEFVFEPFLNLSTPNRIFKINYDNESELTFVVDFIALPHPNFFITYLRPDTSRFDKVVEELDYQDFQVSPNRLIIKEEMDISESFYMKFWIIAINTEFIAQLFFKILLEGRPIMRFDIHAESISSDINASNWNKIEDAKILLDHFATYDKIDGCKWSHEIDEDDTNQHWQIETYYDSIATKIAWVFQPCFNTTTCIPLKDLDKTEEIIGGMKMLSEYHEIHDIIFEPKTPGYVFFYAENVHGIELIRIGYDFEFVARLSIITEHFWNPHLKQNEIAVGEDLIFECEYPYFEGIYWKKNFNKITETDKYIISDLRSRHMNVHRMEVKNVTEADWGIYQCGDHKWEKVGIIRKVPPVIRSNLTNNSITKNFWEPVNLQCEVERNSITSFFWYKDGEQLNDGKRNSTILESYDFIIILRIENFAQQDAGKYSCVAVNNFGSDERFIVLKYQNNEAYIIVGLVISLISILIMFGLYIRIHLANKQILELKAAGLANFEEGNLGSFNKSLGLNEQADLLPYDPRFEFPLEKLSLKEQLGSGAFGVVYKAITQGIKPMESETIVAVKTINKLAPNEMLKALVVELKIMVHMGQHLNIVNLLGAITKNIAKRDLMVISEYCCYGDLEGFLRKHRSSFEEIDSVNTFTTMSIEPSLYVNVRNNSIDNFAPTVSFNTSNLISWSFQVACGMDYLSSKKVLHGDLAARNVLLCSDHIVKISDFGLAKSLYQNYVYQRKDDALLPYKWLALECLIDNTFSVYSDIWAYGVLVWEIFTLGQSPYPEVFGIEPLLNKLQSGYRLTKPECASQVIYDVMLDCWNKEQKRRPSFSELEQRFGDMMNESSKKNLLDLNEPFIKANQESIRKGRIDLKSLWDQEIDDELEGNQPEGSKNYKTIAMTNYSRPKVIQ